MVSMSSHTDSHEVIEAKLTCRRCGHDFEIAPLISGCPVCIKEQCLSVLEVAYAWDTVPCRPSERRRIHRLGKYANLLPGGELRYRISLGEGAPPLIRSGILGPKLGLQNLYFKNETSNPTWSFKDRYVSVTVNIARSLGYEKTVVSSTGNLGVSAAAYSAAAGMQCLFVAPPGVSSSIMAQAGLHGAMVAVTPGEFRHRFVEHVAVRHRWFPIALFMPWPIHNPFGVEGYKSIGYELIEEFGRSPAAVLFPCARGNGLYGTWKGFKEAKAWGWVDRLPKMIGCQPVGANSLEESLRCGATEPVTLPPVQSVAFSTSESVAGGHALSAIRESDGIAVSATDQEILAAVRELGREGLCVETAAALPVACLPKVIERDLVSLDDTVVCVLTAAGIKWPDQLSQERTSPAEIEASKEAIDRFLDNHG
jgi:threonine synthase